MGSTILQQLDCDWKQIVRRRNGRAPWPRHRILRRFGDLDALIEFVHERRHPLASDRVLAALAREAPADELAARTLLQAMTPALRRIASTLRHRADADEVASATVAAAWDKIRTYPYDRRPSRIAANLAFDTFRVASSHLSESEGHEPLDETWLLIADVVHHPWELAAVLQDAIRRDEIQREDVDLVIQTRVLGRTLAAVAAEREVSEACLRQRRWRAEQRLTKIAQRSAPPRTPLAP